ncbi:MAG: hypothetical protein ACJ76H_07395 [Bacteriovoracaceae bacterium]
MKALLALLLPLTVSASVIPYKEVFRQYKNLDQLDLSECEKTFRFVNGNWMDCRLHLPELMSSPVAKIANFVVDIKEKTIALSPEMNFFIRIETAYYDANEGAASTHLLIQAYYQKPGDIRIHSGPSSDYSFAVLKNHLTTTLREWNPSGKTVVAYSPGLKSKFIEDEVIGDVFIGESIDTPDAEKCLKNYVHEQEDNWPSEEVIFYSQCTDYEEVPWFALYLQDFWSTKLKNHPETSDKVVYLPEGMAAQISYSAAGFSIILGKSANGIVDYNFDISPDEAFPLIRQATKLGGPMTAHFYVLESHLPEVRPEAKIIGKLALKRSGTKDEIDYQ